MWASERDIVLSFAALWRSRFAALTLACMSLALPEIAIAQVQFGSTVPGQPPLPGLESKLDGPRPARHFKASGFAYLSYMATPGHPRLGGLEVAFTQARLRWQLNDWSMLLAPRVMLFSPDPGQYRAKLFLQTAYIGWSRPSISLQVGRLSQRLGRMFGYGFQSPAFDDFGVKQANDLGLSLSGSLDGPKDFGLAYSAQYFLVDGTAIQRTRGSLEIKFRPQRRHTVNLQLTPTWTLDSSRRLALVVAGQRFDHADRQRGIPTTYRALLGAEINYGPVNAFFEAGRQFGDAWAGKKFIPDHSYLWTGINLSAKALQLRYQFSMVQPLHPNTALKATQLVHQPGIIYTFNPTLALLAELSLWRGAAIETQELLTLTLSVDY